MDQFDHFIINRFGKLIFTKGDYVNQEIKDVGDREYLEQIFEKHPYLPRECREAISYRIALLNMEEAE